MSMLDLSGVTRALLVLVREAIRVSPAWGAGDPPVSPLPPDRLANGGTTLGLYCFHATEDPAFRSQPPPGGGPVPVALTPMGLTLGYQLSAHVGPDASDDDVFQGQLLLGLAVKALRDHAILDDTTRVNGLSPLAEAGIAGRANRLRIHAVPVPVADVSDWWNGQTAPMRLAAWFQVGVVFLEPEAPESLALPVLGRAPVALAGMAPRVDGTRSTTRLALPGGATRDVESRPARVVAGGTLHVEGADLVGDTTTLVVAGEGRAATEVDATLWSVVATRTRVAASVAAVLDGSPLLPGVYTVGVRVTRSSRRPDGTLAPVTLTSNRSPFQVAPALAVPATVPAAGTFVVTGGPFQDAGIPTDHDDDRAVQVWVGTSPLAPGDPTTTAGAFAVLSATEIRCRLPEGYAAGAIVPIRVVVRTVDAAPAWTVVA